MSDDEDDLTEMIDEYRQLCEREGEIESRLEDVRYDKCRAIAELNHAVGEMGQYERDVAHYGEENVDDGAYVRAMKKGWGEA